jgi:hypothetical protein
MIGRLCFVLAVLTSPFKSRLRLEAENAALRHQLMVLRRRLLAELLGAQTLGEPFGGLGSGRRLIPFDPEPVRIGQVHGDGEHRPGVGPLRLRYVVAAVLHRGRREALCGDHPVNVAPGIENHLASRVGERRTGHDLQLSAHRVRDPDSLALAEPTLKWTPEIGPNVKV